jgi:hypothetical protein
VVPNRCVGGRHHDLRGGSPLDFEGVTATALK